MASHMPPIIAPPKFKSMTGIEIRPIIAAITFSNLLIASSLLGRAGLPLRCS